MTTIRKPKLEDLLNLQHCVDGYGDLPFNCGDVDWNRYAMVAEGPGKKIIGYVSAYACPDKIWDTTCGFINKTVVSRHYEDTSVIADLALAVEKIFNSEGFYHMKADVFLSTPKTVAVYKQLGYSEDPTVTRPGQSMVQLRKGKKEEAQEEIAVAGAVVVAEEIAVAGAGAADIVEVVDVLNDHLPEAAAGGTDGANVALTKSQKRRQRRRGAAAAAIVHIDADAVAVLKDRVHDETGAVLATVLANDLSNEAAIPSSQRGDAVRAPNKANVPLTKSQKREQEEEEQQQQQQ